MAVPAQVIKAMVLVLADKSCNSVQSSIPTNMFATLLLPLDCATILAWSVDKSMPVLSGLHPCISRDVSVIGIIGPEQAGMPLAANVHAQS